LALAAASRTPGFSARPLPRFVPLLAREDNSVVIVDLDGMKVARSLHFDEPEHAILGEVFRVRARVGDRFAGSERLRVFEIDGADARVLAEDAPYPQGFSWEHMERQVAGDSLLLVREVNGAGARLVAATPSADSASARALAARATPDLNPGR
jgi:hypothetical protein